jgi:hypothetical protein
MFFSRIHQNFKRQDWFTVGLEFMAVVFGVFIALQADNWNEWRKERIEEQQFLQRLHNELVTSNGATEFAIGYMTEHARMAGVVLKSLDACEVADVDKRDVANGLYQLGQVVPPNIPNSVFGELRFTGRADIIRSQEVREAISMVVTGYDYYMSFHGDIVDRITPHISYVSSHLIFHMDPETGAKLNVDWDDVSFDILAVCNDHKFKTSIATGQRHTYEAIRWNQLALARHENLANILVDELERIN